MRLSIEELFTGPYGQTAVFFIVNIIISAILFGIYKFVSGLDGSWSHYRLYYQRKVIASFLLIASVTFLWYSISLSFTVYNKWVLKAFLGGFDYPMTNTTFHMIVKFIFAQLYIYFFKPEALEPLPWNLFLSVVVPIGYSTVFDIALSNESLSLLSISMYTISKTTVIGWTFMWSCIFGLESFSFTKLCSICIIMLGLSVSVISSANYSVLGVVFCLGAALLGGLRWVLVQKLSDIDPQSKHPIISMYRFSGVTVLAIAPFAIFFEFESIAKSKFFRDDVDMIEASSLMLTGGAISCALIIVELYLITLTSSLTLSVLGELKEALQIAFGMLIFHDHLSGQSLLGVFIILFASEIFRHLQMENSSIETTSFKVRENKQYFCVPDSESNSSRNGSLEMLNFDDLDDDCI